MTHVDHSSLSEHDWNEIVVDGRGNAYLNNIEFDLMAGEEFKPGIVALVTPEGSARQVADGVAFPNGMAVTPDGSTPIIAESYATKLTAFDIEAEGDLTNRRVWAELDGPPDGICIDAEGAVWAGSRQSLPPHSRGRRSPAGDRLRPLLLRLHPGWSGSLHPVHDGGRVWRHREDR